MILFRRYSDKYETWWKYAVEHPDAQIAGQTLVRPFITANGALEYIASRFPGETFTADTRATNAPSGLQAPAADRSDTPTVAGPILRSQCEEQEIADAIHADCKWDAEVDAREERREA